MRYQIDGDARIVEFDTTGVSAEAANEGFLALIQERPDLWHWDWVVAINQVAEGTTVGVIGRLADGYAHLDKTDAITVMVSPDANLQFWAKVLEFQYPGRRRHVVPQRADALSLIAERRGAPI